MHGVVVHVCRDVCFRATKFLLLLSTDVPSLSYDGILNQTELSGAEDALPHSLWNE